MPRETPRALYLPDCPRFVFGVSGDLSLSLPSMPRDYTLATVGGDIEADSGVRAAFIVRRDELWTFTVRFFESEWPALQAFIVFAQTGALFTYYPDALDPSVSYSMRLLEPAIGKTYAAAPDPNYPVVQLLSLTVITRAVPAPPETGEDLPAGLFFDYDADDAIFVDTVQPSGYIIDEMGNLQIADLTYHGAVSVTSRVEGGPPLLILGARPGWYDANPELKQHSLIRAWGSSNNNPMQVHLAQDIVCSGATLIAVHRPGRNVGHGFPFQIGAFQVNGVNQSPAALIAIGIVSGTYTIGGWRAGSTNGDPGELYETWLGTAFFQPQNYTTHGPDSKLPIPSGYQTSFPVRPEDNNSGDPFNVTVLRINQFGQVTMFENGTKLPFGFTSHSAPYHLDHLLAISSAGGSLDLSGGQAWEWTRMAVYSRWLTDLEVKNATRILGRRYNIVVA